MPRRIAMHAQPQRTLKRLIKQYGQELVDDPRRTEALLRDLCGQHTREIFVIVNAQRLHVASELQSAPAWLPYAAVQSRLTRQLQTKLALTEDAADWAVDAWAAALDITPDNQQPSLPWGLGNLMRGDQDDDATPRSGKRQAAKAGVQSGGAARRTRRRGVRAELGRHLPALVWPAWPPRWTRPSLPRLALGAGLATLAVVAIAVAIWMAREEPAPVNAEAAPASSSAAVAGSQAGATPSVLLETLSLSQPGVYLRDTWDVPLYAQVTVDGLFVREGPATGYRDIAILSARDSVRVVGFSDDGVWSQIDQPRVGWVSNEYLQFEAAIGASVRLQVSVAQAKPYEVVVRDSPRAGSSQVGVLPAGTTAVVVGVTTDDGGMWLQMAQPAGWVTANDVTIVGSP